MSCVNIHSQDFISLVKALDKREKFIAEVVISKYLTDNNTEKFPDFTTLKQMISDFYNTNQGGVDYTSFYSEVKDMIKKLLPGLSDKEIDRRIQFIDRMELMRLRDGKKVLSTFIDNTIYIANSLKEERGTKAYTDVRHEVFHTIFNNFLSEKEQTDIVASFKRWKPQYESLMDLEEIEEKMAEAFEDYKDAEKKPFVVVAVKNFFEDILRFFGLMKSSYNNITRLFNDVNNGKFTRDFVKDSLVTRDKSLFTKHPELRNDPDLFLQIESFIINNLNELMYPESRSNLSEKTSKNLFLKEDHESALFKNNKDLFKLGLNKEDALDELQKKVRNLKNEGVKDEQLSRVIDALSKDRFVMFKDVFEYLQPYSVAEVNRSTGEIILRHQKETDETEKLLEDDETNPDNLQINSKELINPITKISEVVKDFLSSITYEKSKNDFVGIDPGVGFVSLLNMFTGLYGSSSVEGNMSRITKNFESMPQGNQSKAVFAKIKKLTDSVKTFNRIDLKIDGMSKEDLDSLKQKLDNAGLEYNQDVKELSILIDTDNLKIENKGTNSVDNKVVFTWNRSREAGNKKSWGPIEQIKDGPKKESNKTFIEKIANQTGLPSFVVAKIFNYNEQRNILAELTKVAGSLRQLNPRFVKVETLKNYDEDNGSYSLSKKYTYINSVKDYKTTVSLASLLRDKLEVQSIWNNVIKSYQNFNDGKTKNNKEIRKFLQNIVVNKEYLSLLSSNDFEQIRDQDARSLYKSLEKVIDSFQEETLNKEGDSSFLRHSSDFAAKLGSFAVEKNNPTSFKTSTANKSKWENVMKNSGYMIFKNLEDFSTGLIKQTGLLDYIRNSRNNYLRFNPIIEQDLNNDKISINSTLLKVGDNDYFIDHQETFFENKYSRYSKNPVPFSKETQRDWINRNFMVMFMLPVNEEQSRNLSSLSYYQQKEQPESAPNVSLVKMGIQNGKKLRSHLMSMILQEAYLNHRFANSDMTNLSKNVKSSTLPGLEKSNKFYFIDEKTKENVFFDADGNLKKGFASPVNGKMIINTSHPLLVSLTDEIIRNLDGSLDNFVNTVINEKVTLNGAELSKMSNRLSSYVLDDNYKLSEAELIVLSGINLDERTDLTEFKNDPLFNQKRAILKKVLSHYYFNSYVNGTFLNQLDSGVTQNYKNQLDEVKRQAGVNAMKDSGLIDDKHGLPEKARVMVIKSVNNFYGVSNKLMNIVTLKRFFQNKKNELADAQAYHIPEYGNMLRKSFGKSTDIGPVIKDQHFEIDAEGRTIYLKESSVELTNELVKKNKTLRDMRFVMTFGDYLNSLDATERAKAEPRIEELYNKYINEDGLKNTDEYMEYDNFMQDIIKGNFMIHRAAFESAVKGSKPKNISKFGKDKETGTFNLTYNPGSVLTINSTYTGIQQAVRHRFLDSFISHFTQLTYLTGLNRTDTSIKNNKIITQAMSNLAKSGLYDTLFKYRASYDEEGFLKANNRTKSEFIKDLKKILDLPGNEKLLDMLNTEGISMNNPLFSEKLMQTFFNSLSKHTVKPKHPGGAFVLQSSLGFEQNLKDKENSLRTPELKTDGKGNILYAECYLPAMYSGDIKAGEMMYYNNEEYNKMFGYRIPSSDLHSSVPLKVIGFYPSKAHDNLIVVPPEVTALHGSDFDIDKLFVVRYGVYGVSEVENDPKNPNQEQEDTDEKQFFKTRFQAKNKIIGQHGIKFGYTVPDVTYNEDGVLTGWGSNKHVPVDDIENIILDEKEKTRKKILELEPTLPKVKEGESPKERAVRKATSNKIKNEISSLEKHLKTLGNIQRGVLSNKILDAVLDNISYTGENAPDVLQGITFDPVKGYEEDTEASQLARVYSELNKSKRINDALPERPKLYDNLQDAFSEKPDLYNKIKDELENEFGYIITTEESKKDLLTLINEDLKDDWIKERDKWITRQRSSDTNNNSLNVNRPDHHVIVHKETYMAADLVGTIANYVKGLAYSFHGITDGSNSIKLDYSEAETPVIDGVKINELTLENKEGIKNQELKSLALNAAIDHVKEQILNMLNVGDNTVAIFLTAISTKLTFHQATMLMLQPSAKELNSSDVERPERGFPVMEKKILEKLKEINTTQEEIDKTSVTTAHMEKQIKTSFDQLLNDKDNPDYKKNLLHELRVINTLRTLYKAGKEISDLSQALSIIQEQPYNLETAYDKLTKMNKFINISKFYKKLQYSEKSEYNESGFKDDLRSKDNLFSNVNIAENENILSALEVIKSQIDLSSELFSENSLQMQFIADLFMKAVSNNSDPETLFTGENNRNLDYEAVRKISIKQKYLKGKDHFNTSKLIAKSIMNFLTTGLHIAYNNGKNLFSLGIRDQELLKVNKNDEEFNLGTVRSYLDRFLMSEREFKTNGNYNGSNYLVSQINPKWRIKPLGLIKKESREKNRGNQFLDGLGIDTNFRDKIRIMTFNNLSVNSEENLAAIKKAFEDLNSLSDIYVKKDENGNWVNVPSEEHPVTEEMGEVAFNIIKASLYTDQLRFGSTKVTGVIPPVYFVKIFKSFDNLLKDLILYRGKNPYGNRYYKNYADKYDVENTVAPVSGIKENLFINTIFSSPQVLPNVAGKYDFDNKRNIGILPNGNIYDFYIDAANLEDDKTKKEDAVEADKNQNTANEEVDTDLSTEKAEETLYNTFKKNPSFLVDEQKDKNGSFKGKYELYMKVGQTGEKENNNVKYYYKKIATTSNTITNSSFDLNMLLNNYKIKDYFNPKVFSIPVTPDTDFSGDKVSLKGIKISSFLRNVNDGVATKAMNKEQIEEMTKNELEELKRDPNNTGKSEVTLRSMIKVRTGVKNLIDQVNVVSLYDSRNLDRVGLRNFKILSKEISADKQSISFELEALPEEFQLKEIKAASPFDVLQDKEETILSRQERIDYINATVGTKKIAYNESISERELDEAYQTAQNEREISEAEEVIRNKEC